MRKCLLKIYRGSIECAVLRWSHLAEDSLKFSVTQKESMLHMPACNTLLSKLWWKILKLASGRMFSWNDYCGMLVHTSALVGEHQEGSRVSPENKYNPSATKTRVIKIYKLFRIVQSVSFPTKYKPYFIKGTKLNLDAHWSRTYDKAHMQIFIWKILCAYSIFF